MGVHSYIGSMFTSDVNTPILATTNNDATVEWLKNSLNARHYKKKPIGWMHVLGGAVKIKTYSLDILPGSDISHLALALKEDFTIENAGEILLKEGFKIENDGQLDPKGYGWRIYRASHDLGSFCIHVAKRYVDDFELTPVT